MWKVFLLALSFTLAVTAQEKQPKSTQIQRGRQLFVASSKGVARGTCHELGGVGTAVAPSLGDMAKYVPPRGIVSTMHMSMTENVREIKTAEGAFPAIVREQGPDAVEVWDISKIPPVLNKFEAKQILSNTRDQKWKHPPASAGYTPQELADLISFLKYAATGSEKEVAVADVE